ncbi:MAG: hypothetical protein EBT83_08510, partial [Betaproteobacteria bacterium]|nr:hypothetical protein [Betaproteobacteria bacterium]
APKVGNDLTISGKSATATATIAGQKVRAKAQGVLQGSSLDITVGHDLIQDNSAATASANTVVGGGAVAIASASSVLAGTGGSKTIKVSHDWKLLGSTNNLFVNDTATGASGAQPDTLVGVTDSLSPITVNNNGSGITIVQDALRNSAIVLSGAPPTNLDALQSTIISAIQATSSSRSAGADNDVNAAKNKPVDGSKICK